MPTAAARFPAGSGAVHSGHCPAGEANPATHRSSTDATVSTVSAACVRAPSRTPRQLIPVNRAMDAAPVSCTAFTSQCHDPIGTLHTTVVRATQGTNAPRYSPKATPTYAFAADCATANEAQPNMKPAKGPNASFRKWY